MFGLFKKVYLQWKKLFETEAKVIPFEFCDGTRCKDVKNTCQHGC